MPKLEKILVGLSKEQRDAVTSDARAIRVMACAGAGKTETMARRVVRALHDGTPPEEIVAFTFTERAARGMKSRILERAGQMLGAGARDRLGALRVGTIHGFCFRLLQERGGLGNFDLLDEHRERAFLSRHGWELGFKMLGDEIIGETIPFTRALELFRRSASAIYNELIDRENLRKSSPRFAAYLDDYERLLEDHRFLTFDRVIAKAVDLLKREPSCLPPIRHMLVDEYQDVNPAQESLVMLLAKSAPSIFVVGDPNQSIFEWRGSDASCFGRFTRRFRGAETFEITENRRSREEIIRSANHYGAAMVSGNWRAMKPVRADRHPAVWITPFADAEAEADWVVEKIKRERSDGRSLADIAILLGSVDTAGAPFIDLLRRERIPFEIGGRSGLFRHDEAQALGRIYAWFAGHRWPVNPYDPSEDITGDDVLDTALADCIRLSGQKLARVRREMERLKREAVDGEHENFVDLYQEVLRCLGFLDLDPARPEDAHVMALWGRFNQLLNDYEAMLRRVSADPERGRGSRKLDWPKALDGFAWYLVLYATGAYEESQEDETAGVGVRLTTIHQAKGLEWPVVFLSGLLGRRFPTKARGSRDPWLFDVSLFDSDRYEGDESSRRRVLYVGITRARDGLFISWFTRGHGKLSKFVDPIVAGMSPPKATLATPVPPDPNRLAAERELRTFAPTELILWRRCPYRYRLASWGYQAGLAPELGYGRAHHFVVRRIAEKAKAGEKVDAALVSRELEAGFYLPYAPAGMREDMRRSAGERLLGYALGHAADLRRTVEAEAKLEFPLDGSLVHGAVDVILADGDGVEVRDYKTAEDDVQTDESDFQVRLYGTGLRRTGRPVSNGTIANLSTGAVREVNVSPPALEKTEREAASIIDSILSRRFPARPGAACANCDFARICRFAIGVLGKRSNRA